MLKTSDFYFDLPQEQIAQTPIEPRDHSRMLHLFRETGELEHRHFYDLPDYLEAGDTLVINTSRVIPARLFGVKEGTGGHMQFLLLDQKEKDVWEVMVKPGKKAKTGARFVFGGGLLVGEILATVEGGNRLVRMHYEGTNIYPILEKIGNMPLPPYITAELEDNERYQTVYSKQLGSAAAPTAGLHFTTELMDKLRHKGVNHRGGDPPRRHRHLPARQGGGRDQAPHALGALPSAEGDRRPHQRDPRARQTGDRGGHHELPHGGVGRDQARRGP